MSDEPTQWQRFVRVGRRVGWFHLLFSFRGRIGRARYWIIVPVLLVPVAAIFGTLEILLAAEENRYVLPPEFEVLIPLVFLLLVIFSLFTAGAITVKRLHDRNRHGAWALICYVPLAVALFLLPYDFIESAGIARDDVLSWIYIPIALWCVVDLGLLPAAKGAERFGELPLDTKSAAAMFE